MSPFYTTLFILCPFDIASCLSELCEEAGWLHAVTGTSSQSLVYWWVTLLVCACKHIAQVPMPFPFGLLGRRGGKCAWSIKYKNNVGSEVFCPTVEHNNQWHSGTSGSEAVQVHPVIGPAARGSDVRLTGLLFEGRETYRDISTLLPRQEVSFLKVGLCSHQSLEPPLSPAGDPQLSLGWGYHPWLRECTAFGEAQRCHGQACSEGHQPSCQEETFSPSPCSANSSLSRNSPWTH